MLCPSARCRCPVLPAPLLPARRAAACGMQHQRTAHLPLPPLRCILLPLHHSPMLLPPRMQAMAPRRPSRRSASQRRCSAGPKWRFDGPNLHGASHSTSYIVGCKRCALCRSCLAAPSPAGRSPTAAWCSRIRTRGRRQVRARRSLRASDGTGRQCEFVGSGAACPCGPATCLHSKIGWRCCALKCMRR